MNMILSSLKDNIIKKYKLEEEDFRMYAYMDDVLIQSHSEEVTTLIWSYAKEQFSDLGFAVN